MAILVVRVVRGLPPAAAGAARHAELHGDRARAVPAMLDESSGTAGRRYLPLIATLGLFILVSNLMGLVPGLVAPTAQPQHDRGVRPRSCSSTYHCDRRPQAGRRPLPQALRGPGAAALKPLMFVIEIISHLARPLSLSLRLFGNMFGGPHPPRDHLLHDGLRRDCSAGRCRGSLAGLRDRSARRR